MRCPIQTFLERKPTPGRGGGEQGAGRASLGWGAVRGLPEGRGGHAAPLLSSAGAAHGLHPRLVLSDACVHSAHGGGWPAFPKRPFKLKGSWEGFSRRRGEEGPSAGLLCVARSGQGSSALPAPGSTGPAPPTRLPRLEPGNRGEAGSPQLTLHLRDPGDVLIPARQGLLRGSVGDRMCVNKGQVSHHIRGRLRPGLVLDNNMKQTRFGFDLSHVHYSRGPSHHSSCLKTATGSSL